MVHHYEYMMKMAEVRKTESYVEASKDAKCQVAMEGEMWALDANKTWDLINPPRHCKPIRCKWVYKIKYKADGLVHWYKA